MTVRTGWVAACAALAAGPALAWCADAGASMVAYKDCLAAVEQRVDGELAIAMTEVQRNVAGRDFLEPTLRARYAAAVDRAQAVWSAWRAVECGEVTGFEWWGGSGAGAAIRECRIATAAARIRDLTARYDLDPAASPLAHADPSR